MTGEVTIGSLFTGAGALCELAVAPLLGGRVVWHCEFEPPTEKVPKPTRAAARVLEHRFPDTPNLGDITRIGLSYSDDEWAAMKRRADDDPDYDMPAPDWSRVERPRVLTGGFPCTDVSTAGQQAGLRPDTRSGLWSQMSYAISVLRPELVVIENVRGLASTSAHSDLEPCPWCLGDGPDQPALRALGAVLGDLADLGYDAVWCGLRASDVGACHGRFRFVILAAPADAPVPRWAQLESGDVGDDVGEADGSRSTEPGRRDSPAADGAGRVGSGLSGSDLRVVDRAPVGRDDPELVLLPTPTAVDARGARNATANRSNPKPTTCTTSKTLTDAVWLLPTPVATRGGHNRSLSPGAAVRPSLDTLAADLAVDWGIYELGIRRHERWLGRPAPSPTITGARGGKTLNPQLSEWMMAWPAGWVTEVPGITPNEAKQVCGNGVVPQQMAAGIWYLLPLLFSQGRWAA